MPIKHERQNANGTDSRSKTNFRWKWKCDLAWITTQSPSSIGTSRSARGQHRAPAPATAQIKPATTAICVSREIVLLAQRPADRARRGPGWPAAAPGRRRRPAPALRINASQLMQRPPRRAGRLADRCRQRRWRNPGDRASRDTSRPTTHDRQIARFGHVGLKPAVPKKLNRRRVGIEHGQLHPVVARQAADDRVAFHDAQHRLGRRLDDEQHRTGSWISTICQGKPGAQVAGRAVHHAEQRRDVVRQLRAAAVAGRIDVGEIVFQVDAGADGNAGPRTRARIVCSASSCVGS